jgi:Rubredoxin-like zinc ribbon domain (DUF35_N)
MHTRLGYRNPMHWRLRRQRYCLTGSSCQACGELTFPPRPVCPNCIANRAPVEISPQSLSFTRADAEGLVMKFRQPMMDVSIAIHSLQDQIVMNKKFLRSSCFRIFSTLRSAFLFRLTNLFSIWVIAKAFVLNNLF